MDWGGGTLYPGVKCPLEQDTVPTVSCPRGQDKPGGHSTPGTIYRGDKINRYTGLVILYSRGIYRYKQQGYDSHKVPAVRDF